MYYFGAAGAAITQGEPKLVRSLAADAGFLRKGIRTKEK